MKLDDRIRGLIAAGASVTANCQPCLQHYVARALDGGADPQEIMEAIDVAKTVRKGASFRLDQFARSLEGSAPDSPCESQEGCGCRG
jgi:AhpD family alkylhydroperoxidase